MTDGRLLIPTGMKPSAVRASRIDAPIRKLAGATMGTGWSLSFVAHDDVSTASVTAALEETFARVIRQMSGWERDSELSTFNRAETGWRAISPEFAHVLARALAIAAATDGAYNPALGDKVDALGFGPGFFGEASAGEGWRGLQLDAANLRVFQPGGVVVDLSSIAKGYAVDLCAQRLRDLGAPSFLMEIGGEFAGQGVKPDAQPWWVTLELSDIPPAPEEPPHTDVALVGLAVATSGDFVRRRTGGSHLLDGRTGAFAKSALSGVAVMHGSAMEADGWATALFALGVEAGLAMADAQHLASVFSIRTPEGARSILSAKARDMLG